MAAKLWTLKVGSQKNFQTFWVRGYIFAILYSELLLFGRPGFDSRRLQTLKAYIFQAFQPTGPKTNFFESSDLSLLGLVTKISFAALLRVLLIGQSSVKLYHKNQIDSERLAQTVYLFQIKMYHTRNSKIKQRFSKKVEVLMYHVRL